MPTYLIAEVEVLDEKQFDEYKRMVPPTIAAFGGRYIARGQALETLEGNSSSKRVVVIEFESVARAKQWWNSEEYSEAKRLRQRCAETKIILVEGA